LQRKCTEIDIIQKSSYSEKAAKSQELRILNFLFLSSVQQRLCYYVL